MQKQSGLMWGAALALGWLFDFLFWKHTFGVQLFIFTWLTLAAGFFLLWKGGARPHKNTLALLLFILFFSFITALRREPLTLFLASALTLFLLAGVAVTYLGGHWLRYSLADFFAKGLQLFGSMVALPIQFNAETRRQRAEAGNNVRVSQFWPILRGILLAIPVLAVFIGLLSSADMIFAARVENLVELFKLENLPEYLFRGFYILVFASAIIGAILHAAQKSADEQLLGEEKPLLAPFFGFTEASIVLGSVALLFGIFVLMQFQYFFGGETNITLTGYTYAEYARRGFGELVTVAFFSLLLFLGLGAAVKRESEKQHKVFAGMGAALTLFVSIILVSAFQRLVLYESAYGFTRLRTYTHVFIIWLGALLLAVAVMDFLRRQRAFAIIALFCALGFSATLAVMNVDDFIARQNIQRAVQGEDLDAGYLVSLSEDAVPSLVRVYQSEAVEESVRARVGAALACRLANVTEQDSDWRAFSFSRFAADKALNPIVAEIKAAYTVEISAWQVTSVKNPRVYDCWSSTYD